MRSSWNFYQTRGIRRMMCSFYRIGHPNDGRGVKLMTLKKRLMGGNPSDIIFFLVFIFPHKTKNKKKATKKNKKLMSSADNLRGSCILFLVYY
jgi:hypothetical protein